MFVILAATAVLAGPQQSRPSRPEPPPPAPSRAEPTRPAQEVHFRNCAEARAAGRQNIRRGEPGYRPALDRDGD